MVFFQLINDIKNMERITWLYDNCDKDNVTITLSYC